VGDGDAMVGSTPNTTWGTEPAATSSLPTTWLVAKNAKTMMVIVIVLGVVLYAFQRGHA
jgi:hypothetical protein